MNDDNGHNDKPSNDPTVPTINEPEEPVWLMPVIRPENIGGEEVNSVDARALHAALGVGKVFGAWINDRIEQCGFKEGVDFVQFSEIGKSASKPLKQYALALDSAKHISMMERNDRGHAVRQYFIDFEKDNRNPHLPPTKRRPDPKVAPMYKDAQGVMSAVLAIGKMLGTEEPMARAIAVQEAKKAVGIDMTPLLVGNTVEEPRLTPTDLGKLVGLTARKMNEALEEAGLQVKDGKDWRPTELGKDWCTVNPYKSEHSQHTGYRIMWKPEVTRLI